MPKSLHRNDAPLFSLAHLTLINSTPAELVYIAARAGYDAVSPRFVPMNVPGEFAQSPLDPSQVQATKTALATTGLRCSISNWPGLPRIATRAILPLRLNWAVSWGHAT